MIATTLIVLSALVLLFAAFAAPSVGPVHLLPLGLALGVLAWLAVRLNLP
jgi:hypothetical protein